MRGVRVLEAAYTSHRDEYTGTIVLDDLFKRIAYYVWDSLSLDHIGIIKQRMSTKLGEKNRSPSAPL